MKTKIFFLTLVAFFTIATHQAQISYSNAGIAVQGIARNSDNSARVSTTLSLKFEIYSKDGGSEVPIASETKNVDTDIFGVFSHIVDPGHANNAAISNGTAYLRISEGTNVISNEKLNHVPYAISANNGVPTGSIMPYIGTTAPTGWVLCNGQSLTSVEGSDKLIALVGNNAPDLQGLFLRGTGKSTYSSTEYEGPDLMAKQGDQNKSHTHDDGSLKTTEDGEHNHTNGDYDRLLKFDKRWTHNTFGDSNIGDREEPNLNQSKEISSAGAHTHDITGNTGSSGGTETRPVNYGVNYIIKL